MMHAYETGSIDLTSMPTGDLFLTYTCGNNPNQSIPTWQTTLVFENEDLSLNGNWKIDQSKSNNVKHNDVGFSYYQSPPKAKETENDDINNMQSDSLYGGDVLVTVNQDVGYYGGNGAEHTSRVQLISDFVSLKTDDIKYVLHKESPFSPAPDRIFQHNQVTNEDTKRLRHNESSKRSRRKKDKKKDDLKAKFLSLFEKYRELIEDFLLVCSFCAQTHQKHQEKFSLMSVKHNGSTAPLGPRVNKNKSQWRNWKQNFRRKCEKKMLEDMEEAIPELKDFVERGLTCLCENNSLPLHDNEDVGSGLC